MRTLILLLVAFAAANANYRDHAPPGFDGLDSYDNNPYCCNVVENVVAELKERVEKAGGNALKLKEILDHCIKKLLVIKSALVKQIEHFDWWIKKNGLPERIGAPGDKGDQGPKGLAGADGPKGEKGEKGKKGLDGVQGHPGRMGRKGDVGETGNPGPQGDPGVQGHTTYVRGKKGEVGIAGEDGEKGPVGPRGPIGERGDKGAQGIQGNPGPQGWCLSQKHKQCQPHHDDDDEPWKPKSEPKAEPELIPNPLDFEEPDEQRIYGVHASDKLLPDPEYCPSCTNGESEPEPDK